MLAVFKCMKWGKALFLTLSCPLSNRIAEEFSRKTVENDYVDLETPITHCVEHYASKPTLNPFLSGDAA